jgi:hypothetical protein
VESIKGREMIEVAHNKSYIISFSIVRNMTSGALALTDTRRLYNDV